MFTVPNPDTLVAGAILNEINKIIAGCKDDLALGWRVSDISVDPTNFVDTEAVRILQEMGYDIKPSASEPGSPYHGCKPVYRIHLDDLVSQYLQGPLKLQPANAPVLYGAARAQSADAVEVEAEKPSLASVES